MKKYILLFILITSSVVETSFAQNKELDNLRKSSIKKIDSLKHVLKTTKNDTAKLSIYIKLSRKLGVNKDNNYIDSALSMIDKYALTADKKQNEFFKYKKLNLCNDVLYYQYDHTDSVLDRKYENICVATYIEQKDTAKLIDYFLYRYRVHYRSGDKDATHRAIEMYQKAVYLAKQKKNTTLLGSCYAEIANCADNITAMKYAKMALPICKKANDTNRVMFSLKAIGDGFAKLNNIDSALSYYNQIFLYLSKKGETNVFRKDFTYRSIAELYNKNMEYKKALNYAQKINLRSLNSYSLLS